MGYNIGAYAVRPSLWSGLRGKEDWLRFCVRKAEANNRFDFDVTTPLRQMTTTGEAYDQPAHHYWYALELLCAENGFRLPNRYWSAIPQPSRLIGRLATAIRATAPRAATVIESALNEGPPVDLPSPEGFPFTGYLAVAQIPAAIDALTSIDLTTLDEDLRGGVTELREWLNRCPGGKTPKDLVTFCY